MTALITFICLTLASAIAAGAFVYGRQIGYTQRDSEVKADDIKVKQEQIDQLTLEYMQLETQYKQDKYDSQRPVLPGGWDPDQLGTR